MMQIEEIKKRIAAEQALYISFDIFDTLIVRPFMRPEDLFYYLNSFFFGKTGSSLLFSKMRVIGEKAVRDELKLISEDEDLTLDEIYAYIGKMYNFPLELMKEVQEEEERLELRFSMPRQMGKQLYDYARQCGKKIIFTSDMYLSKTLISKMLLQDGYEYWDELFVSSETKCLKRSGKMYGHMVDTLKTEPHFIMHIGDNEKSDYEKAKEWGLSAAVIPKTVDIFYPQMRQPSQYGIRVLMQYGCGDLANRKEAEKSIGYGSMISLCAHRFADEFEWNRDLKGRLNSNLHVVGYCLLGMYVMGLTKWVGREVLEKKYKKIWFASRDGWLIMQAYNIMRRYNDKLPEAEYLYISREAVMPILVKSKKELFQLPIEVKKYSPAVLIEEVLFFCKDDKTTELAEDIFNAHGIEYEEKFRTEVDYAKFISVFIENLYDKEKHNAYKTNCYEYLKKVEYNHVIYDSGYSGRVQNALAETLGHEINNLFLYRDSVNSYFLSKQELLTFECFYDYYPQITGMIREIFLSEVSAPCIGYQNKSGMIQPIFAKDEIGFENEAIKIIQQEAVRFIEDYYKLFGGYTEGDSFKSMEVMLPFEGYLRNIESEELEMFKDIYSGDKIYGRNPRMSIARFWRTNMENMHANMCVEEGK